MKRLLIVKAFLCFLGTHMLQAQLLTINGGEVNIEGFAMLTVKGDLTLKNGAVLSNTGTIELSGDWEQNSGATHLGLKQKVVLNGHEQIIKGTENVGLINMDISGGTGKVTLQTNLNVNGDKAFITFGNRQLDLNKKTLSLISAPPNCYSRNNGYAISESDGIAGEGAVFWQTQQYTAGTKYVFPFGNTHGDYLPLTIEFETTSAFGGTFIASTWATDPTAVPNNRPLPTGVTNLLSNGSENDTKTIDRYWRIEETFTTTPSWEVTFTYADRDFSPTGGSTNSINESLLQAQRWDGSQWESPIGAVDAVNNEVSVTGLTAFSPWTLTSNASPLPVTLIDWQAVRVDREQVELGWSTDIEINNSHFEVWRALGTEELSFLTSIEGAGYSSERQDYGILDENPFTGTSYYQLHQVDADGNREIFPLKAVDNLLNVDDWQVYLYPNPSTSYSTLRSNQSDLVHYSLHDPLGRVILEGELSDQKQLDISELEDGWYLLVLTKKTGQQKKLKLFVTK